MPALNAIDMIEQLKQGKLQPQPVLEGMVKPLDNSPNSSFLFSAGTTCGAWIEIDADSVESVEVLGNSKCKDHSHPVVRLVMKPASNSDKQSSTLFSLVTHLNSELAVARAAANDPDGPVFTVCRNKPWLC